MVSRPLPILAVQAAAVAWDAAATYATFETELRDLRVSFPQTRLFIYPELHLSALGTWGRPAPEGDPMRRVAEPIPGPLTDRLCALAKELGIWLLPGTIYERCENDVIYNTAIAIGPDGTIRARYRKIFPWRPWERTSAGREFVVFDIDGVGRAGLMTCYDIWFPEVARHLRWMGAEVIFCPTLTDTSDRAQELVLARATAIVNQLFVVSVNAGGALGVGRSTIVGPEGHELVTAGDGEAVITQVLDLDAVEIARRYGTGGLNRMWDQLEREGSGLPLPLYGGDFSAASRPVVPRRDP